MKTFTPHSGQIFTKRGFSVFVITAVHQVGNNAWYCLLQIILRDGCRGRIMTGTINPDDTLQRHTQHTKQTAAALRHHRAMQRRRRAAYVNDDSCEVVDDHQNVTVWGI